MESTDYKLKNPLKYTATSTFFYRLQSMVLDLQADKCSTMIKCYEHSKPVGAVLDFMGLMRQHIAGAGDPSEI